MTISLDNAVVYDEESFPNAWILTVESLFNDNKHVFEISDWRNDIQQLVAWIDYMKSTQTPMIGFNNVGYDYPMLHHLRMNAGQVTAAFMYQKNNAIIGSSERFGQTVWPRDRLVPQIDLFKIHHMDNEAKRTTLKALQVNMRAQNVLESRIPFGTVLTEQQLRQDVIPYGLHDTSETKRFAHYSMEAMQFRLSLVQQFGVDALEWNDTKIGEMMLIARLGDDICFDRSTGRKQPRQTVRTYLPVRDMLFPYISFMHPEFQRVHQFMQGVTLTPEDMKKETAKDKVSPLTIHTMIDGVKFKFGSGGVHASVERQRFVANDDWAIRDIDVAGMYPAISNVNRMAPEHLGEPFIAVYASLPEERAQFPKGTPENLRLKLAGNAAWGKSKSPYSCFYDPKYALTVPINGQLMICMLVDQLRLVPTLQIIQANTDGVTYYVRREHLEQCYAIEKWWQSYTCLVLEDVMYSRMFVRDVNNYIAEDTKGKRKLKGAYWWPKDFQEALDAQSAHKDYNPTIVQRTAVAAMFDGFDPETFLRTHSDPFDFMLRVKLNRGAQLYWGDEKIQSTTRYYVARNGRPLTKRSMPPEGCEVGQFKRAAKITKAEYERVMRETGGQWDARVCSKNKSRYEVTTSNIEAGWLVQECNDMRSFDWNNVNYDYYLQEVRKLII